MLVIQASRDSSASSGRPNRIACEILEVLFSAESVVGRDLLVAGCGSPRLGRELELTP